MNTRASELGWESRHMSWYPPGSAGTGYDKPNTPLHTAAATGGGAEKKGLSPTHTDSKEGTRTSSCGYGTKRIATTDEAEAVKDAIGYEPVTPKGKSYTNPHTDTSPEKHRQWAVPSLRTSFSLLWRADIHELDLETLLDKRDAVTQGCISRRGAPAREAFWDAISTGMKTHVVFDNGAYKKKDGRAASAFIMAAESSKALGIPGTLGSKSSESLSGGLTVHKLSPHKLSPHWLKCGPYDLPIHEN
ncbi:hypothetical protein EDB92DRAFT_1812818 [Lactarius akahatsu]|uniref:Uncharacterized protein n=1 Tax=Lactarius akahatsu TaxID=416441 RepID=A0AAD4LV15_9AGAM|nr:hypothetical protein EDB92DRAFT_1812818 [Lactarius akahatsu]